MAQFVFDEMHIDSYWANFPDAYDFLKRMEGVEEWVLKDASYDILIDKWTSTLDESKLSAIKDNAESFLIIIGMLPSTKSMYLLNKLSDQTSDLVNALTAVAISILEDDEIGKFGQIYLDRLNASETQLSLRRLLDIERLALVTHAIKHLRSKGVV